jgi:hypothetical protein
MEYISQFLGQIDLGENLIYRGHSDRRWVLRPSVGRHYEGSWCNVIECEMQVLADFKKRAIPYVRTQPKADIEWLCLMQHHGLSTRLLDFTSNPLIALFFASDPSIPEDGEFIAAQYGRSYENVSDDNLFNRTHSFAYHPPHITERIISQQGCFVYANRPNEPLEHKQMSRITVKKEYKSYIRQELSTVGINHSLLFPGIDGICNDLNERLTSDLRWETIIN